MRINQIKLNDVANGEGISISVWTQGCPHKCEGCFNTETWSYDHPIVSNKETLEYIFKNIDSNGVKRSLSILGGEPLCNGNIVGVWYILKNFKEKYPDRKTYLWTGYTLEDFTGEQAKVLPYIDVLIDGKFEINKKNLNLFLRGSSNQRVIDINKSLKSKKIILYI